MIDNPLWAYLWAFSAYKVVLSVITQSYDARFYNRTNKHELEQACTREHFILCVITQVLHARYNLRIALKYFIVVIGSSFSTSTRRRDAGVTERLKNSEVYATDEKRCVAKVFKKFTFSDDERVSWTIVFGLLETHWLILTMTAWK